MLFFAVGFKRHHDAASAHKAAGRLRFTVAVAGIVGVDVQVKLVVLTVVLAGFDCGRKELNAVGFKLFLSGTAILRVFLQEGGVVLFVLGILGIREVSIKAFGRIGYTVLMLLLRAALKCHDAAVDNGCTTVVFAFFKDDDLGAVIDSGGGCTHAGNAGTCNHNVRCHVPFGWRAQKARGRSSKIGSGKACKSGCGCAG